VERAREKLGVPKRFLFYPAQTFPHKNHLAVVEALALLRRNENLSIPFVSSGYRIAFSETIRSRAQSLGLDVQLVGFVTPMELQCLYRLARAVVIPSRFEAASFPLWEAQLAGVPAACSNLTSLPLQGGDSILLFDPDRPAEIAQAVARLWIDEGLRETLIRRGQKSVERFTWERTARIFRAHYCRIARWPMSDDDQALLASRPIL
jgi:glycosyltransferase involved in cell wall biosynthesis